VTRGSEPKPRAGATHLQILIGRLAEDSSQGSHVAVRERLPKRLEVSLGFEATEKIDPKTQTIT